MCKDCGCGQTENEKAILHIPGMMCDQCKATVEGALLQLPGVMAVDVNLSHKDVTVNYNGTKIDTEQMKSSIDATGFEVEGVRHTHVHSGFITKISNLFK